MLSSPSLVQGHGYKCTMTLTSESSSSGTVFCFAGLHSVSSSSDWIGDAVHCSIAYSTTSSTSSPTSCNCSSRAASSFSTASTDPVATTAAGRILAWFLQYLTIFPYKFSHTACIHSMAVSTSTFAWLAFRNTWLSTEREICYIFPWVCECSWFLL